VTLGWELFGLWAGVVLILNSYQGDWEQRKLTERNFFGVVTISVNPSFPQYLEMSHGTTIHGMQSLDPARRQDPISYYCPTGPIGQVINTFADRLADKKIAVIGLGIGSIAAYARPGQQWTFYEIDPAIQRLAQGEQGFFTYLPDCERRKVPVRVVLGDGRIQLQQSADRYALIVADAFSSDSIPIHLLTREAVELYLERLEENGILALHISSKYLDLAPVVEAVARDQGLASYLGAEHVLSDEDLRAGKFGSEWAILVRRSEYFAPLAADSRWQRLRGDRAIRVWTDDYSNLWSILRR
jgi:hypothetical protein